MSSLILTPREAQQNSDIREHGRIIARDEAKVEKQKNMMKATRRKQTMLNNAAEQALSGK